MPHIHELYDFTASAFIVHPTELKICLHFHKKFNSWMQVGGHVELDEDPEQALAHEIFEEAGLKEGQYEIIELFDQPKAEGYKRIPLPISLNVHPIRDKKLKNHKHIDLVFLVRSKTEHLQPHDGESQKIGWFGPEDIEKLHNENKMMPGNYSTAKWIFEKLA